MQFTYKLLREKRKAKEQKGNSNVPSFLAPQSLNCITLKERKPEIQGFGDVSEAEKK